MATRNTVDTSLAGQTGTGNFVGSTSPTFVTPVLGAAAATSIAFSSTTGIIGTTTNDSAAAGSVGEYVSSVISYASRILVNSFNTAQNLTSISLTAGDWNVYGNIFFEQIAGTSNGLNGWISTSSATQPDASLYNGIGVTSSNLSFNVPFVRMSLSVTTTIYLSGLVATGSGTWKFCGGIFARRVR
jgi:hypothetical protein